MISACLTPEWGVLASDSARYDKNGMTYESQKLHFYGKYLITYIGAGMFLRGMNPPWFHERMDRLMVFLGDHLNLMEPDVAKEMPDVVPAGDDMTPRICMYILGVHDGRITLAELNTYAGHHPVYCWSPGEPVFTSIYFGDDNPKKKVIFVKTRQYMEKLVRARKELSPGLVGEILTRGIYHKADLEERAFKKKYAGGVVSVAVLRKDGKAYGLSNVRM